jgi:type IV secretory pathway VirB3-like protein
MTEQPPMGIHEDPLFAGVTRPAMAMGVTYSALLINGMTTVELFLLTKNLLWMLICIPIHGIFWLVCKNDARFFDRVARDFSGTCGFGRPTAIAPCGSICRTRRAGGDGCGERR